MRHREAGTQDAVAIAAIHAESWRTTYRGALRDENQLVVVTETKSGIGGFACAYGRDDERWGTLLDNLHVRRELHRRGTGSRLLSEVAKWSRAKYPAAGLYLWVVEEEVAYGGVATPGRTWRNSFRASEKITMKLNPGDTVQAISVSTIHGKPVSIPDPAMRYVHLQFRRFAGCPVCNFHLHSLSKRHADVEAAGVHEIAFFHSSRNEMLKYQAQLPFDCVADPSKKFYRQFGVETSFLAPLHPAVLWAGLRGVLATGKFYKKAENGILGLPADFLIDSNGKILASHYGAHAYDNWDADELLRMAT